MRRTRTVNNMKIAFLSLKDMRTDFWSGIPQAMVPALERQGAEVRVMGAVDRGALWWPRLKHHFYRRVTGRTYLQNRDDTVLRSYARRTESELAGFPDADGVFTPFTATVAFLNTAKPVAFWHDSTFASLLDYYSGYESSALCGETIRSGHRAELAAIRRADLLVYASDWAARKAIEFYHADPAKVLVAPYGANLPEVPSEESVEQMILQRTLSPLQFLIIGGDWVRKGGETAFQLVETLNQRGIPSTLHAVGARPEGLAASSPFVRSYGRLNKNVPSEMASLHGLLRFANFLLLPSTAECMGIVSCEANAFGVPVLSSRTGGIPTVVRDEVNGQTFDLPDMVPGACQFVEKLTANRPKYLELCRSSYQEFKHRLNWDVSTRRVLEVFSGVVKQKKAKVHVPLSASASKRAALAAG